MTTGEKWIAHSVLSLWLGAQADAALITGEIVDAANGEHVAARLYIQNTAGEWFFANSSETNGMAVSYARTNRMNPASVECHTTLSAHPFHVELPPGSYTLSVERGKEFHPLSKIVELGTTPVDLKFELSRWVNMATRNWFSGETHVHRSLVELPTLNVERVPNAVVISWPNPSTGFILERTMTLNVGHVWSTVTNTSSVVGQWKTVTLDSTNATEFYRLRRP